MADTNAFEKLETLLLSAQELKELNPNWADGMIEDYLNQFRNMANVAINSDQIATEVNQNATDIGINATAIGVNATAIGVNATAIGVNATDIGTNATNLTNHINSDSQHGVTGDNVGTQDFCTNSVGGVVLIAAVISDLVVISTADIAAAPALYDQTYTDTVATLVNENKAKINEIVAKINAIIDGQQTAKQMAP